MSVKEQRKVLDALAHNEFWADFEVFDKICYGGDLTSERDQRNYARAVIEAFPKDIRDAYNKELRKEEANKLRAKADKIERGCPSEEA